MKKNVNLGRRTSLCLAMTLSLPFVAALAQSTTSSGKVNKVQAVSAPAPAPVPYVWATVANSATVIPGGDGRLFNSFNQPSVNSTGLVALRARSKGEQASGEPLRGIYSRQMGGVAGPLNVVFDTLTEVPQPNNTLYSEKLGTFTEFPAFPRIGLTNNTIASRGQSKPVYTYYLSDNTETRAGTSGVYVKRLDERVSAMTQLGAAPGFDYFSVPGAAPGTRFDQFPGSPAVAGTNAAAFKGNYTEAGVSKTGIFFRYFNPGDLKAKTQMIASSNTVIPGQLTSRFGSTAPPSAADTSVVFLGLDNEEAPTMGGIYQAPLATNPKLKTLVSIGGQVPGESPGVTFNKLGEALSYDGRYVAFWGAWGASTRSVTLACPQDGQAAVIAYCNEAYPSGYSVAIPVNQGFFLHDSKTGQTQQVVKTGLEYIDFLYWTYSGRPPSVGESDAEDFEAPRWRSAAFVAMYSQGSKTSVAFKGRKQSLVDGIYLTIPALTPQVISKVIETGMDGSVIDLKATGLPVISVGLERDGLRNGWLAIAASMANADTGWAGVYLTRTAR